MGCYQNVLDTSFYVAFFKYNEYLKTEQGSVFLFCGCMGPLKFDLYI